MLLTFLMTSALIEITPGPNMTYLAIVAASKGRFYGFATVAGIACGLALIGLAAAFGVAEVVNNNPLIYEILRWAGVVFMAWLAYDTWRQPTSAPDRQPDTHAAVNYFKRGLITNLLNPKAAVFYMSVLPQFTDTNQALLPQTLWLTALYVAIATGIHAVIVMLAGRAAPLLAEPTREMRVRRMLSVLMFGVALWFAWSTAR